MNPAPSSCIRILEDGCEFYSNDAVRIWNCRCSQAAVWREMDAPCIICGRMAPVEQQ